MSKYPKVIDRIGHYFGGDVNLLARFQTESLNKQTREFNSFCSIIFGIKHSPFHDMSTYSEINECQSGLFFTFPKIMFSGKFPNVFKDSSSALKVRCKHVLI